MHVEIRSILVLAILYFSGFSLGSSNSSNMAQVSIFTELKLRDDIGMQTLT